MIHFVLLGIYLIIGGLLIASSKTFQRRARMIYYRRFCETVEFLTEKAVFNSVHYEDGWIRPALPIGVDAWCQQTLSAPHGIIPFTPTGLDKWPKKVEFYFRKPADAVAFKLRWC